MTSLRAAIRRLSIKPGDIVLVRDRNLAEQIARTPMLEKLTGTPVIYVEDFNSIRTVSERIMNMYGWFRK